MVALNFRGKSPDLGLREPACKRHSADLHTTCMLEPYVRPSTVMLQAQATKRGSLEEELFVFLTKKNHKNL